jgi:hypothetical protein
MNPYSQFGRLHANATLGRTTVDTTATPTSRAKAKSRDFMVRFFSDWVVFG